MHWASRTEQKNARAYGIGSQARDAVLNFGSDMFGPVYLQALSAAGLFALSIPLSKLLLSGTEPLVLSGLLYLGAGAFSAISLVLGERGEAGLRRDDLPWLFGAIVAGGVLAPLALLYGLRMTPVATASLLLNVEAVATASIAELVFRESVGHRTWAAVVAVATGSVLLGAPWRAGDWGISPGVLLVVVSTLLWGLENNLTRSVSLRNPKAIVTLKGFVAGAVSLGAAMGLGMPLPAPGEIAAALAVGGVCYGASIVLYVRALRHLGAARTAAIFGIYPFLAAAVSLAFFRELPGPEFIASLPLFAAGAYLILVERHEHFHVHEPIFHDHLHRHDDGHHDHLHPEPVPLYHTHPHRHRPIAHSHAHHPDIHHRHLHGR